MYLKLAEEEDYKVAERWRADAGGILVFVSPHIRFVVPDLDRANQLAIIDRCILCRSRSVCRGITARPQSKLARYNGVLSRQYLSAPR
jgi:hypothetical protein